MSKKNQILSAALFLFSNNEYAAVSTIKIAQKAKVSDALIFKHFKNKNNLYTVLIEQSEKIINNQIDDIKNYADAKSFLKKIIEFSFDISEENYPYFKFYIKLKWNQQFKTKSIWNEVKDQISFSLDSLQFGDIDKETGLLIIILDGLIENIILNGKISMLQYKYFLIHKYTL